MCLDLIISPKNVSALRDETEKRTTDTHAGGPVPAKFWSVAGTAQRLELWTCDRKVSGSSPAGTAGEFSSPWLTFWLLFRRPFPPPCYRSNTYKIPVILPKVQVARYK